MTGLGPDQGTPRGNVRFIGDEPGRFVFLDRTDPHWDSQVFAFSARSVATTRAVVTTDVAVERGERVALRFDNIGIRRGVIERALKGGFIVNFTEMEDAGDIVDARIDWLKKKTRGRAVDRRRHGRVMPREGAARLVLGATNVVDCRIKDMSASGAAVLPTQPPVGSLLAVAPCRHGGAAFRGRLGVQFLEEQDLTELEVC